VALNHKRGVAVGGLNLNSPAIVLTKHSPTMQLVHIIVSIEEKNVGCVSFRGGAQTGRILFW
jgi:hypothetical protein